MERKRSAWFHNHKAKSFLPLVLKLREKIVIYIFIANFFKGFEQEAAGVLQVKLILPWRREVNENKAYSSNYIENY